MDAVQFFLPHHQHMHTRVGDLTNGLTEAQIRKRIYPEINPLAWILWHIARTEDASINLLIGHQSQVFSEEWMAKLRVARRDFGIGMTIAEVDALSAEIDLMALDAYWIAVGDRTATVVRALTPAALDEVISQEQLHWAIVDEHMVEGSMGASLEEYWKDMTKGYCLVYLPFTHIYEHIGQADLMRGLVGLVGAV